jgi:hypothetical protein
VIVIMLLAWTEECLAVGMRWHLVVTTDGCPCHPALAFVKRDERQLVNFPLSQQTGQSNSRPSISSVSAWWHDGGCIPAQAPSSRTKQIAEFFRIFLSSAQGSVEQTYS